MDHRIKHFFPLCLLFVIPQNIQSIQTRLISLVCHLIISCDFSCTAAQHLQSSGSICRVFRQLSTALVSFASQHCSVFSQALDLIHGIVQYCLASFPIPRHSGPLFFATLFFVTSFSVFLLLLLFFASEQPHLENVRSFSAAISLVGNKLK